MYRRITYRRTLLYRRYSETIECSKQNCSLVPNYVWSDSLKWHLVSDVVMQWFPCCLLETVVVWS